MDDLLGKGAKIGIAVVVGIALLILVLVLSDVWNTVWSFFNQSSIWMNILFIIIAGAAVVAVIGKGK